MEQTDLQKLFLAFREQCIWLRICYNTYSELYESGERVQKLMESSAPLFFHDLNNILIEYIMLHVCKITDPAETRGRANLTLLAVNESLNNEGLTTGEISQFSQAMLDYRELVKDARNRLISHFDRDTILNGLTLGEHPREDAEKFFECLQGYIDAVGNAVGVGPLDFRTMAGPGDVLDLIKLLRDRVT
tara:strand:+ start:51849 stop:52415 length:567 start_codon:yes stop_codon:yes gene_type:complete